MPKKKPKRPAKVQTLEAVPEPPADMPAAGQAYWREVAPMLVQHSILTALHLESFRVLCELYADYRALSDYLRENPAAATFTTDSGYEQESPRVRMRDKALAALQKLWPKFGLTPQALAQLNKHCGARGGKLSRLESFAASKYDDDGGSQRRK